ncbi:hypothetical protein C5167_044087 [Papaver somniferum]|uniref:F-box domain-containing protein n=1 Tax=Papaver somniferum TaxID=3469 RepID=A0A4Y7L7M8_PAPSO|nr:hypothetical protein C5167_044087 [Papaver somniferum]
MEFEKDRDPAAHNQFLIRNSSYTKSHNSKAKYHYMAEDSKKGEEGLLISEMIFGERSFGIMVVKNKKKHKQMENNNTGVGKDYISNLPDALIHHILSFLPTKSAMSTCILSKRWKYVAATIPVFDFCNWRSKRNRKLETKLFMNFLDSVLFLHENPNIQKFSLGLDEVSDEFRVYGWVSTIMKQSTVKISAPNLLTISYTGDPPADFVLDSFWSLVEADVGFDIPEDEYSNETFVLSEADVFLTNLLAFNNLIHLEGSSIFDCPSFGSESVSIMRRFFRFLQLSPNLESIVFAWGIHFLDIEDDDCWSLDLKCSLPHLKSIKFKHFEGKPMEVNTIKVFLKYPGFSGTVTIVACPSLSKTRQINLKKLLCKIKLLAKANLNLVFL